MKGPFIVFEGVDGAGKSEVSARVSEKLGAVHLESPTGSFREIRQEVDDQLPDKGRLFFYMASNFHLSRQVETQRENNTVICSRYFHSTFIGYAARNQIPINDIYESFHYSPCDFILPNLTIFLYVSEEVQRSRIQSRSSSDNSRLDNLSISDDEYRKRLFANYVCVAEREGWVRIDASLPSVDDVVESCIRTIKAQLNGSIDFGV